MSYELIALPLREGETLDSDFVTRYLERKESTPRISTSSIKERLADALLSHDQDLERFEIDHRAIAEFENISIEQARKSYNHIELNSIDDTSALQIQIFDSHVTASLPFWYQGEPMDRAFARLWSCLKVIQDTTGYALFDPQIGRMVHSSNGYDNSLKRYANAMQGDEETSDEELEAKKPWWKFW